MSRLIDADALLENMRTHCEFCKHNDHHHVCREDCVWHEAMDEVEDMPEIEATTITASDNGIAVGAIHGGITINRTYNQTANEVYNIGHLERMDNMMSDYRAISDTACDTTTNEQPTIGMFIHKTIDMQEETMAIICNIANMMWGDEITTPAFTPKENIMAGLAAIQENQRAILTAVKTIIEKL